MGPRLIGLAKSMVDLASMALSKLVMFMDCFYHELVNTYGTDDKEAWHLVSSSIAKQYFTDLYAVLGAIHYVTLPSQDKAMVGGTYLWAT
jgi:hypothetical protein